MLNKIKNKAKKIYTSYIIPLKIKNKIKIFCIGRNKTGTTSLKKAFINLGFVVGNQRKAELLLDKYIAQDFEPIIKYCRTAEVFQDVPFSYPGTYKYLDKAFPNSKFILSVRDSPEQWYNSLTKFHAKLFGHGKVPTAQNLKDAVYIEKGRPWRTKQAIYKTPEEDPYNKEIMINHYINYNAAIKEYFKDRPDDLIVINIAEKESYNKLMDFLNIDSPYSDFPWENKTTEIKDK